MWGAGLPLTTSTALQPGVLYLGVKEVVGVWTLEEWLSGADCGGHCPGPSARQTPTALDPLTHMYARAPDMVPGAPGEPLTRHSPFTTATALHSVFYVSPHPSLCPPLRRM